MVMEEEPAPEYVGREFVRQYYTVLHMCPENLHRFYSTESSFVHGGLEPAGETTRVAKGQTEIHKRIMSLNLRECRAKIRQVDSFETVNGALVIQVIGELANAGEALRRFVQTFVLVQQSPKSYYVYNDIFRYQDDVFHVEDEEPVVPAKQTPKKAQTDELVETTVFVQTAQDTNVVATEGEALTARNGNWSESEDKKSAQPSAPFSQQQNASPHNKEEGRSFPVRAAETSPQPSPKKETVSANNIVIAEPDENRAPASNKPLTFAAVAGGGRSSPPTTSAASSNNTSSAVTKQNPTPQKNNSKPSAGQRDKSPEHSTHESVSGGDDTEVQPEARQTGHGNRTNFRQQPVYPNEQQVFVGNLPQDVSDEELQEFMNKFGPVAEVKIVNKAGRQQGGKITPAFAFVTFDSVDSVDKMISQLPINDFRGQLRLNIERKQERERTGNYYGNQGGNYRGGHGGPGGRGGMRGGMQGRRFAGGPRNDNKQ